MSKFVIETTLTHKSLMNKSKWDLSSLVLDYADLNGKLHQRIKELEEALAEEKITALRIKIKLGFLTGLAQRANGDLWLGHVPTSEVYEYLAAGLQRVYELTVPEDIEARVRQRVLCPAALTHEEGKGNG